jgi:hypothetical protein
MRVSSVEITDATALMTLSFRRSSSVSFMCILSRFILMLARYCADLVEVR